MQAETVVTILIGLLSTISLGLAGWALTRTSENTVDCAVHKTEINRLKDDVKDHKEHLEEHDAQILDIRVKTK